jgi:phospholipase/carboxylesterase
MAGEHVTRRRFGGLVGGALASLSLGGACDGSAAGAANDGRLRARPRKGITTAGSGSRTLGLADGRDAILQLPPDTSSPLPLLVLLHGAGGSGAGILKWLGPAAADAGLAVLAPDSRGGTWDAIRGRFGADVEFLDRALARVFETTAIDPRRVAAGGFSDGATYAVSLGLVNGDLFSRVLAFSPGFIVEGEPRGRASFFISHGTRDRILPIDRCSRVIVDLLKTDGHHVIYREFDGGHTVPADLAREGLRWVSR